MVEETSRRTDNKIDTLCKLFRLCFSVSAAHDNSTGLIVMLAELFRDTEDLKSKLASRRDDDDTGACYSDTIAVSNKISFLSTSPTWIFRYVSGTYRFLA